jgi:YHS domain-containing protein
MAQKYKKIVVLDLVCGMDQSEFPGPSYVLKYKGKEYLFCSEMCKTHFQQNPDKYLPPKL